MNEIHPTAIIGPGVELGDGNIVGPYAVIQGPCVSFLHAGSALEPELSGLGELSGLAGRPVQVLACANSLRSAGLEADQLQGGVSVVPAAVAHLSTRQFTGWAYVRV